MHASLLQLDLSTKSLRVVSLQSWLVTAGAFALVGGVGAAQGGYFPTSWGWIVLGLGWAAGLALVLRREIRLGRLELATLGALVALVAWVGLSIAWSDDAPQAVLELQRGLVYVVGLLAALVIVRRRSVAAMLWGLQAAIVCIAAYGLSTRLFPETGEGLAPIIQNRLSSPLGYWNALGALAVMGALLALGFAAHGRLLGRVAAAASLPILLTAMYFTYSRGSWLALAAGLVALFAVAPTRLRLASAALALAPASVAAVLLAAHSQSLTRLTGSSADITHEGRRLALEVVALALVSGLAGLGLGLLHHRFSPPTAVRRAYGAALVLVLAAFLGAFVAHYGGPSSLASRAYHSFKNDRPANPTSSRAPGDLNQRLFTLRSNGRIEFSDVALDTYRTHRWLGAGAGSYETYWVANRPFPASARDAHSLYMETLAELGPLGIGLLAAVFGLPLAAALRVRRSPMVPAAAAAYTAFLVHAAVDWDWEMPVLVLSALLCGAALLVSSRTTRALVVPERVRAGAVGLVVLVVAASALGLVGNRSVAASTSAVDVGSWATGLAKARVATRWAPWSAEAWQALGNAQLGLGRRAEAQLSLRRALAKSPHDWRIWYDLGVASRGDERLRAYRRAAALNPLGYDISVLRGLGYVPPLDPEGQG